ncbi:MAG TPA: efflux RND transporter periplasmic adaptor subunit, partial [Vicinamibacterales bacterium]|nr:efflux RND transporter periplasmic adaptor subunit [Vicinamibacterales bacterium]
MTAMRSRTIATMGGALLLVLVVLLVAGAVPRVRANRALSAAAESVRSAIPAVYVVQPAHAADADLSFAATTQAFQDAIVYARTSGYVSRRHVDIGDRVRAGQLLADIASPEIDQQLTQARADLRQAEKSLDLQNATLELARVTMARYQAADAERAVAKEAVDQSVAAVKTAQAAVAAAEASVESNRANVQRLLELTSFERVVAPFAGTIIQRNVDVGALITAGSPTDNTSVAPTSISGAASGLFEVAQIDALRVFVNVPQAYAASIKVGTPVRVSVRGRLMEPVTGAVTRTANALDPGTRTLLVEVDIPNASHELLPGMFVYVGFTIGTSGIRWRVPATAVVFDAEGTRVVTVGAGNALHFQPVVLGRDFGDSIDVQAGLQGSETIVRQPTLSLREGQVVRPITSSASS